MEVCASAHHWGRQIQELGHEVRLIPPVYVKPYVKRQKNDANDAGAIVEAAQRPTMRFVAVKTEAEQARSVVFRARELLVHQRTQTINALRGHLAEFGLVAPLGVHNVRKLEEAFHGSEKFFPALAPPVIRLLIERIHELDAEVDELDREIRRIVREDEALGRLMTIPEVGELTAMAVHAFAPPMESFRAAGTSCAPGRRPGDRSRTGIPSGDRSALPGEPGRGFCQDVPLELHLAELTLQLAHLVALGRRQAVLAKPLVPVGLLHPAPDRRCRRLELFRQTVRTSARPHQLHHPRLELRRIPPSAPPSAPRHPDTSPLKSNA